MKPVLCCHCEPSWCSVQGGGGDGEVLGGYLYLYLLSGPDISAIVQNNLTHNLLELGCDVRNFLKNYLQLIYQLQEQSKSGLWRDYCLMFIEVQSQCHHIGI